MKYKNYIKLGFICCALGLTICGCAKKDNKEDIPKQEIHHLGDLTDKAGTNIEENEVTAEDVNDNISGYELYEGIDWVINYPNTWIVNEDTEKLNISIKSPNYAKNSASIVISTGTTDKNLEQFSAGFTSAIWENDGYLRVQDIKLGSFDAKKLEYRLNKIDSPDVQGIEYIVVDENIDKAYIVNLSSDAEYYSKFENTYKDIITSFKLLEIENPTNEKELQSSSLDITQQGWDSLDNKGNETLTDVSDETKLQQNEQVLDTIDLEKNININDNVVGNVSGNSVENINTNEIVNEN